MLWLNKKAIWGGYGETIVGKKTSPFLRLRLRRMHGKYLSRGENYHVSDDINVRIDVIKWTGPGNPPDRRVKNKGRMPKGWVTIGSYKTEDEALRRLEQEARKIACKG